MKQFLQAAETKSEENETPTEESSHAEKPPEVVDSVVEAHVEDEDDEEVFDCNICDFRAMDEEDLKQHFAK